MDKIIIVFKNIFSCVEYISAFVLQNLNSPMGKINFFGEFLYTCITIVSVFEFSADFRDEFNTLKSL